MNQRIRELFKRAGGKTSVRNLASNPVQVVETHELWDDRIEKFAELIVRECAGVCDDERDSTDSEFGKLVAESCSLKIMERFGVEE